MKKTLPSYLAPSPIKCISRWIPQIAVFLAISTLSAQSPEDLNSANSPDLKGANWIWNDEPGMDSMNKVEACAQEFTKIIVIPQ